MEVPGLRFLFQSLELKNNLHRVKQLSGEQLDGWWKCAPARVTHVQDDDGAFLSPGSSGATPRPVPARPGAALVGCLGPPSHQSLTGVSS